jgi:hypothetical protein
VRTDDLIDALAADARIRPAGRVAFAGWAMLAAVATAAVFLLLTGGVRSDFTDALGTASFDLKVVTAAALAVAAGLVFRVSAFPERPRRTWLLPLVVPVALLAVGVALELAATAPEGWAAAAIGRNGAACLTLVPMIGALPLVILVGLLRNAAPGRPALGGAAAGLFAGAMAATAYATYCTDDSPLFVLAWYPAAIAPLVLAGAVAAARLARW